MKDKIINVKTIIIIVLIGIIISMFFIVLNMKNKSIVGQEVEKEQLGELATDNAYITLEAHNLELKEKQQEINNIQNTAGKATITADKILKDYTAYKDGKLITGTMANNGAVTKTLNAGGSYTIPAGYHNGNGKVTVNSLASQTQATATASDILSGKTAWVNGTRITGNSVDNKKEEYLMGTSYTYTVDGGISETIYSSGLRRWIRSSQSACGVTISGVDLSNYKTLRVSYYGLTSMSVNLYVGSLPTVVIQEKSGTFDVDITEIKTTANIKVALGGSDGQVYISSLILIP